MRGGTAHPPTPAAIEDINTLTLETMTGLTTPGLSIVVKCYVLTTTGNEKASNAVKVVRP